MLEFAGEDNLAGKVLLDIANPLDVSQGCHPRCSCQHGLARRADPTPGLPSTGGEGAQRGGLQGDGRPGQGAGEHDVLVCGEDEDAKRQVTELLESFGWPAERTIDLGGIRSARGIDMYPPLWLRLWGALGASDLNIRVVRAQA